MQILHYHKKDASTFKQKHWAMKFFSIIGVPNFKLELCYIEY